MKLNPLFCHYCGKAVSRSIGRINEANKRGWKTYCSLKCQGESRNKQQLLKCSNPECNKTFKRTQNQLRKVNNVYCSRSCASIVNNSKYPKNPGERKICVGCGKEFVSREKYCSRKCKDKAQLISSHEITDRIKNFHKETGRIPLKREFKNVHAARRRFGSWNNAIKAAGFNPNPVKFAKKWIANDGHKCDSLAEKIIDDWLYARKIPHEINVPYNKNNMTADFKVNGVFIKFLGLHGELEDYDRLVEEKKKLWKKRQLKIIKIYPKDLFPKNRLNEILIFP